MATTGLSPILQIAKEIISESKTPSKGMHVNDIAKIAVSKNKNLGHDEETFARKLSTALAAHLKTKKPIFTKPTNKQGGARRGIYALRRSIVTPPPINVIPSEPINTLYAGKAGEYAVASELLFWGFNVSMMAVDQGIDLIAEKEKRFFHIQVKTCSIQPKENTFSFQLKPKAFTSTIDLEPWYIFVMREGKNIDYAIIPHTLIMHLYSSGIINTKSMSFQISRDEKRRIYKLNMHEINMYINNFGLILPKQNNLNFQK